MTSIAEHGLKIGIVLRSQLCKLFLSSFLSWQARGRVNWRVHVADDRTCE